MDRDDLLLTLGRIEAKLDGMVPTLVTMETRVSDLEKWQGRMAGGLAVLAAIFGVIVASIKGWTPHGG